MNYGYDSTCPGYKPSRKRQLAADLAELVAMPKFRPASGRPPYVEIDGMYRGVRIRKITDLTEAQVEELTRMADDIFDRVMA